MLTTNYDDVNIERMTGPQQPFSTKLLQGLGQPTNEKPNKTTRQFETLEQFSFSNLHIRNQPNKQERNKKRHERG